MKAIEYLAFFFTFCLLPFTFGSESVLAVTSASEYRALGLSYRASERYSEAISALKKSVELDPQNLSGRVMLGWTQHLAGQEDAAVSSLLQALSQDPVSVPALNALGIVCLVSGELRGAVVVHTWAAILEPENEIAYYNLSLAFHRLQLYGLAIAAAKKAAALEPANPHPIVALAIAHWDMRDHTAAQQAYRQALNLDSSYRDRAFLVALKQAGFSPAQIQTAEQVLSASNPNNFR
jgi:Flp pilus assembly protein TadD